MDRKIDEHFGFEAADNVEGVLATLAPDATHDIVGYPTGPTHGRESARQFYVGLFGDLSESNVMRCDGCTGRTFWWTSRCGKGVRRAGRSASKGVIGR
jgi:hypothetical protein